MPLRRASFWKILAYAALGLALQSACASAADELALAGIRRLESNHLTLFTDVPVGEEVDALPACFDLAYPQWCAYFGVDPAKHADWHPRGYLMMSRERFEKAGLVSPELPNFLHGYARGTQIWLNDQTSAYYRRHLLLHEGTHLFMETFVAGLGPPWYSEAMAELLSTHSLVDGTLTLGYFPKSRGEVPKWGRIEFVQRAFADRRALTLEKIIVYPSDSFFQGEPYGWCWALAAFFENHPRYRERFHKLPPLAAQRDFNGAFRRTFADDWTRLQEDWQLYVANLEYGYDFQRMEVEYSVGKPLTAKQTTVQVTADRSWQSGGIRLSAGQTYTLTASGRYQVAKQPRVWWSEPAGVTIEYYHGQPLGLLLAAVRDDANPAGTSGLIKPVPIGAQAKFVAPVTGTLYLRINDTPAGLADNAGSLEVTIAAD